MTASIWRRHATLAIFLLAWLAPLGAYSEELRQLRNYLARGKPVIVIVSPAPTAAVLDTEAYADWSGYLNDFMAGHHADIGIVKVRPGEVKSLFLKSTPISESYATIFIRPPTSALFYDGMIIDKIVYHDAEAFFGGHIHGDLASVGLKPFHFEAACLSK